MKWNFWRNRYAYALGIIVLAILIVVAWQFSLRRQTMPTIILSNPNVIAAQTQIENALLADYKNSTYNFVNPYIIQDPYQISPLTALVIFDSPEPVRVSVWVKGKDPTADFRYRFDTLQTHQEIPIIGLYSGADNTVQMTAEKADGSTANNTLTLHTEPLSGQIPSVSVTVSKPELMESGWTLVNSSSYKYMLDSHGDTRWFLNFSSSSILNVLPNGHLLMAYLPTPPRNSGDSADKLVETDLLGKFSAEYFTPYIHHDVIPFEDSYLATVGEAIYQFDPHTGSAKSKMNSLLSFFPTNRMYSYIEDSQSLHLNAFVSTGELGNNVLISARNQSALLLLQYPDMQVQWIMGNPDGWTADDQSLLLRPVGSDFEWFWMQHAPQVLPDLDLDPDTTDILLFDNGLNRNNTAHLTPDLTYSRIVQYRVHNSSHTIEQIWEYGKERGTDLYSSIKGSAEYLPTTGDYLGTFAEVQSPQNGGRYDAVIVEVNGRKEVVSEIRLQDTRTIYRAQRLDAAGLIAPYNLGQNPGIYLENNFPSTLYKYPQITQAAASETAAGSLYLECMQRWGHACVNWPWRRLKIASASTLNVQIDGITMTGHNLSIHGKAALSDGPASGFFMVLSSGNHSYTYDIGSALIGSPEQNGLQTYYVNELDTAAIPGGIYTVAFYSHTNQGIGYVLTNYALEIPTTQSGAK